MALDVGVHDRFEMLKLAVLEKVDDVDLREKNTGSTVSGLLFHLTQSQKKKNKKKSVNIDVAAV